MTKKSRVPPPPRHSVKAPKRRYEPTTGGVGRRTMLVALALAAAAVAVIAIAVAATRGGGGSGEVAKKLAAAGCTVKTYPDQGRAHVQSLDARVDYNSFPPTSGSHYAQPAVWGRYPESLVLVQEVHNLEHGGVVIQYGSRVPHAAVAQLETLYDQSPNGLLLAPLPNLAGKIALTAWTHLASCGRFDESAVRAFRDAYRGKGPERFPVSALTPGS